MKNRLYIFGLSLAALTMTGCMQSEPKPEVIKECNVGHLSSDQSRCLVTNKPLMAIVQSIEPEKEGYKVLLSDERGRKIEINIAEKVSIGERININLYKDPILKKIK